MFGYLGQKNVQTQAKTKNKRSSLVKKVKKLKFLAFFIFLLANDHFIVYLIKLSCFTGWVRLKMFALPGPAVIKLKFKIKLSVFLHFKKYALYRYSSRHLLSSCDTVVCCDSPVRCQDIIRLGHRKLKERKSFNN